MGHPISERQFGHFEIMNDNNNNFAINSNNKIESILDKIISSSNSKNGEQLKNLFFYALI